MLGGCGRPGKRPLVAGFQAPIDIGYLLTNYHVIRSAATAEVRLDNGLSGSIMDVVMEDEDLDLALVQCLIRSPEAPAILLIAEGPELPIGEKVYAIGSPQGLEASLSEGIISGRREMSTGIWRLQTTAPISPGSSGGPLLNSTGAVVGIVQATRREGQNLNFVIPASQIISFLEGPYNTRELWRGTGLREEEYDAYIRALSWSKPVPDKSDIGVLLCRARDHIRAREYEEATNVLANAVPAQAGKQNYLLFYTKGRIAMARVPRRQLFGKTTTVKEAYALHRRNEDYQLAIKLFRKSIELDSEFSPAYQRLAETYSWGGQFGEALEFADVLVRRAPHCATAYKLRGDLHENLDHDLAAYRDLTMALELGPGDPETHLALGRACGGIAEYAEAVEAYENALRLFDDDPTYTRLCYSNIANALKRSGQYEKALAYYEKAKKLGFWPQFCDEGIAECRSRLREPYP